MPIRKVHALPKVGDTFNKVYKHVQYTMTIVKTEKGIGYKVENNIYSSPSAAATSVSQNAVNGWIFWHIEK